MTTAALAAYFLRLGAIGFGGPAALTDRMRRDLVEERGWMSDGEFELGLAVAAACPGPLAYQLAVFCGHRRRGAAGAVAVAVAFALVPFCLVTGVAALYDAFGAQPVARAIFYGVGPVVVALIVRACWHLGRKTLGGQPLSWLIGATGAALISVTGTEHAAFFLAAGLAGILWLSPSAGPKLASVDPPPPRTGAALSLLVPSTLGAGASGQLFAFFAKTGCLVFGSGLVIVPILRPAVVDGYGWLTEQQFIDAVAIGLVSPGPVVITATFVGYTVDGLSGAFTATAGMFLPAVVFTLIAAPIFQRHGAHPRVRGFVRGITAAVVGALAGSVPLVAADAVPDRPAAVLACLGLVLLGRRWPDPLVVLLGAAGGLVLAPPLQ